MKKLILPLFLLCFFISGYSQSDTLFTKTKQKIVCKIMEINDSEIKYKLVDPADGPMYVIGRAKLFKYTLSNGFTEILRFDELSIENEHGDIINNRTVIKIQPFSLVNSQISMAFEHVIKVGTNLDVEVGYVNSGINRNGFSRNNIYSINRVDYSGAYIKPGVKFFLGQDFSVKGLKYAHPLKGRYVKLDLAFSFLNFGGITQRAYTTNPNQPNGPYTNVTASTNINTFAYGGFVNYGRQFILGNVLTMEYYFGVGFTGTATSYSNPNFTSLLGYNTDEASRISNYHGFQRIPGLGLSGTAGFRIGYIIPNKKDKMNNKHYSEAKK